MLFEETKGRITYNRNNFKRCEDARWGHKVLKLEKYFHFVMELGNFPLKQLIIPGPSIQQNSKFRGLRGTRWEARPIDRSTWNNSTRVTHIGTACMPVVNFYCPLSITAWVVLYCFSEYKCPGHIQMPLTMMMTAFNCAAIGVMLNPFFSFLQ